jgi:hypothetical protein
MSVTIYEHHDFTGAEGYFPDRAYTDALSRYSLGLFDTWNDDISSLYTSTSLIVFEDEYFEGDSAFLEPGFHDLASLNSYGIENDDIGSFYALY